MNPEKIAITVIMMALKDFDNLELASLNNAITGFGKVDPKNHSYQKALDNGFINSDGTLSSDFREYLPKALTIEINSRVDNGTFN